MTGGEDGEGGRGDARPANLLGIIGTLQVSGADVNEAAVSRVRGTSGEEDAESRQRLGRTDGDDELVLRSLETRRGTQMRPGVTTMRRIPANGRESVEPIEALHRGFCQSVLCVCIFVITGRNVHDEADEGHDVEQGGVVAACGKRSFGVEDLGVSRSLSSVWGMSRCLYVRSKECLADRRWTE